MPKFFTKDESISTLVNVKGDFWYFGWKIS